MLRVLGSLFVSIVFAFVSSCSSDEEVKRNTLPYFEEHLQKDMTHTKVMTVFGKPDKDVGSGIHIYVYSLADSTEVWIGVTDALLYANHIDKDQNLLKVLI